MRSLFLQYPMMHGDDVRFVQKKLAVENDGWFGEKTDYAVRIFQAHHNLKVDGIVGKHTRRSLERFAVSAAPSLTVTTLIDRRGLHAPPKGYAGKRAVSSVIGVCIHQTACLFNLGDVERWDRVNTHIGFPRAGLPVLVNDPTDFIHHCTRQSKALIGLEFEGTFEGVQGNPKTLWGKGSKPSTLTEDQLAGIPLAFEWLSDWFSENAIPWLAVYAHRQFSGKRRSDPGSEIWQAVALPWRDALDLGDDYDGGSKSCLGTGRPIPTEWDPNRTAKY